jgi:hypothetical protein
MVTFQGVNERHNVSESNIRRWREVRRNTATKQWSFTEHHEEMGNDKLNKFGCGRREYSPLKGLYPWAM